MATLTVAYGKGFVNAAKSEHKTFDPSSEIRTTDFSNRRSRCNIWQEVKILALSEVNFSYLQYLSC